MALRTGFADESKLVSNSLRLGEATAADHQEWGGGVGSQLFPQILRLYPDR